MTNEDLIQLAMRFYFEAEAPRELHFQQLFRALVERDPTTIEKLIQEQTSDGE